MTNDKTNPKRMPPMSGEKIDTSGIYANESGREALFERGDTFPAEVDIGRSEWHLVGLPTEEQLQKLEEERENTPPRLHVDRQDK